MSNNAPKSNVALREEEVLAFWEQNNIFQKSLEKDFPNGSFTFNDGPPFATGTPHYGHLLQSGLKDSILRYKTMNNYRVDRSWGWDCHGLPIENIVEKELGTKSKKDVEELGVKKFNDLCREKIFTYVDHWKEFIPRFGRWADMEHPHTTMDTQYMESEWWAFKELYDKGLVYEDYRSMHVCPRCATTLAQSEVSDGYKMIKDWSVTVKFPLKNDPNTSLLAWTTTPWTLPGNVAIAVGPDVVYATVEADDQKYIVAKGLVEKVFENKDYTVISEQKGTELVGLEYIPPFDSYLGETSMKNYENAWKVYAADFVTDEDGTGIAHEAPAFGAEDMELAQEVNLPLIHHVEMTGIIKEQVKELAGRAVKPKDDVMATDVEVIKYLAGKETLFAKEKYEHSYPHCWRCDTPLINYATSSWFVAVEKIKDTLLETAKDISWTPAHSKEGRWGEWLKGARDWGISRQRFWANTIPVWKCEKDTCNEERVFGSIAELNEASGTTVTDLHKDVVDDVTVPCSCGGDMHRVSDVLDTWFDSGSVPFATKHYPFENKEETEQRMPVDFIVEAQDQISKWFYYQHVLTGALFEKPAFQNVLTSGMVLAEDGKKMSKSLKNYPDPQILIDERGADAVRLYILSSPAVKMESMSFSEADVVKIVAKVIGRFVNSYTLYAMHKDDLEHTHSTDSENVLDQWIIQEFRRVHSEVTKAMNSYEIDKAVRNTMEFMNDFSTWYVRRSRDRYKGDDLADKKAALETTQWILRSYAKLIAPFAPFIAEWMWQNIKTADDQESVHLATWDAVVEPDRTILDTMKRTREIVSLALDLRTEAKIKVRQPLQTLTIGPDLKLSDSGYMDLIQEEVNVKSVQYDENLTEPLVLDTEITPELQEEGDVRELIRTIQSLRKKANFSPKDRAVLTYSGDPAFLEKHWEEISAPTGLSRFVPGETTSVEKED